MARAKFKSGGLTDLQAGLIHLLDNCDIEWFALEMNRDHSVSVHI